VKQYSYCTSDQNSSSTSVSTPAAYDMVKVWAIEVASFFEQSNRASFLLKDSLHLQSVQQDVISRQPAAFQQGLNISR